MNTDPCARGHRRRWLETGTRYDLFNTLVSSKLSQRRGIEVWLELFTSAFGKQEREYGTLASLSSGLRKSH